MTIDLESLSTKGIHGLKACRAIGRLDAQDAGIDVDGDEYDKMLAKIERDLMDDLIDQDLNERANRYGD